MQSTATRPTTMRATLALALEMSRRNGGAEMMVVRRKPDVYRITLPNVGEAYWSVRAGVASDSVTFVPEGAPA